MLKHLSPSRTSALSGFGAVFSLALLLIAALSANPAYSASRLEFTLTTQGQSKPLFLDLSDGKAWVRAYGGPKGPDLLFDGPSEQWIIIDHSRRRFSILSEKTLRRLASDMALVAPLIQGLGDQIRHLEPQQKQRWGQLLQGVPIEELANQKEKIRDIKVLTGLTSRKIGGIPCSVVQAKSDWRHLELCLAKHESLNMDQKDTQTLKAMESGLHRLAEESKTLLKQLGTEIKGFDVNKFKGIPILITDQAEATTTDIRLTRIHALDPDSKAPGIPEGYREEKIKPW